MGILSVAGRTGKKRRGVIFKEEVSVLSTAVVSEMVGGAGHLSVLKDVGGGYVIQGI